MHVCICQTGSESHSLSSEAFSENIHWSFQSIKIFYQDYFRSFRQAESYKISLNESIVFKFIGGRGCAFVFFLIYPVVIYPVFIYI